MTPNRINGIIELSNEQNNLIKHLNEDLNGGGFINMIQQIIKNPENVDNADKFEGQIVSNTRKNYVRQMSEDLNSGKQTLIKRELKRRR